MGVSDLDSLFRPSSIAIVGASERSDSMGSAVMQNLLHGHFSGPVLPINPQARPVFGVYCYDSIASLPLVPELAVICTSVTVTPMLVQQLGDVGTKAAIIITMDPDSGQSDSDTPFRSELIKAASSSGIRLLGPGSTGVQVPALRLNASWILTASRPGKVALISQSGSFAAGLVEWAHAHDLGLSHVVSTGDAIDINIEEIMDYFATRDPLVHSVLLNIRSVSNARRFMSAARGIARSKTVIAICNSQKQGTPQNLISRDSIYDAAIRRAGMLRVYDTDEIFNAVETLSHVRRRRGERLAILSNGQGPGEAAAQAITQGEGEIVTLDSKSHDALCELSSWIRISQNLISIGRDADVVRYRDALSILIKDPKIDALLVMHTPTSVAEGEMIAGTVIEIARSSRKSVLACWIGQEKKEAIHKLFSSAGIPLLSTPDRAARAFLHLVHFQRNQEMLLEAPGVIPEGYDGSLESMPSVISNLQNSDNRLLNEQVSAELLESYGISVTKTCVGKGVAEVLKVAKNMAYPMALRRCANTVVRGPDIASLALDLFTEEALKAAAEDMVEQANDQVFVQSMTKRTGQYALRVSIETDPEFGPVISLSIGGNSVHATTAHATALPPLNMTLASELVSRSKVLQLLGGDIDRSQLCVVLVKLSQLIIDAPQIAQLEINPLLAGPRGVSVLEVRIGLRALEAGQYPDSHLAIRPYPRELEERVVLGDGESVQIRPVRPEDEDAYKAFFKQVDPTDMFLRFFSNISELPNAQLANMIQVDYDREMAFTAFSLGEDGNFPELLGEVRTSTSPDNSFAEYSVILRADMKGTGLGRQLMEKIITYSKNRGTVKIVGSVLVQNTGMLRLCRKLGFQCEVDEDDSDVYEVQLNLQE